VSHGTAELAMDLDRDGGWVLSIDEVLSSYLDLRDLTHLEFEYVRWIGDLLDCLGDPGEPLRVAHLGGAGCTLPIYIELTRPGSTQVVLEYDEKLVELVKVAFGIRSSRKLRLRTVDALEGLRSLADASLDVVVRDAFGGPTTPPHLSGPTFLAEVRRVLDSGVYIANVADRPPLGLTRQELSETRTAFDLTAQSVAGRLALLADPSVLRGRRYGNVVIAASTTPLPLQAWMKASTRAGLPARVVHGERLVGLIGAT